jgi:WD40 repeat protein
MKKIMLCVFIAVIWCQACAASVLYRDLKGHTTSVSGVDFSPDSNYLASCDLSGSVRIWDISSGTMLLNVMHGMPVEAVQFSPSGKTFATAARDGSVKLWQLVSGSLIKTFDDFKEPVFSISFSPDGKYLASGSNGRIIIWSTQELKKAREIGLSGCWARSVRYSGDGKYLASSCGPVVKVWDINHNDIISKLTGGGGVSFREKRSLDFGSPVYTCAFSPDSEYIAAAGEGGLIKVWRAEDGFLVYTTAGHEGVIWTLGFSKDGKLMASGGADRLIKIWDAKTGKILDTIAGQDDEIFCVAFSPAGNKLAGASRNMLLRIWQLPGGPAPDVIRNAFVISLCAIIAVFLGFQLGALYKRNKLKVKNWKP